VVEIGYDRDYNTPEAAIPRLEDARLIALAPEMAELLAELEAAYCADVHGTVPPGDGPEWMRCEGHHPARALLARARGEA
jgi:hypothetical protein